MLEQVARGTIERLLSDAPPDPLELAKAMAPMVEQRRVYAWSADEQEQADRSTQRTWTANCSATSTEATTACRWRS